MTLWIFSNLVICERLREIQYPTSTTDIGLLAKYPSRLGQFMKLNQSAMSKKMEKRIDDHIHISCKLLNLLEMSLDIRLLITRPGANPTWRERSFWNTLVAHHSSPRNSSLLNQPFQNHSLKDVKTLYHNVSVYPTSSQDIRPVSYIDPEGMERRNTYPKLVGNQSSASHAILYTVASTILASCGLRGTGLEQCPQND